MRLSFLTFFLTGLASFGCAANDARNTEQSQNQSTVEANLDGPNLIQSLSSLEWAIPSYMSYGDICNEFIEDLTENPDSITIIPPTIETDDWDDPELQGYVEHCDRRELTAGQEYNHVRTSERESAKLPSGKFFYADNQFALWESKTDDTAILYTGPRYRLPERPVGYVSEEDRESLDKEFVYGGVFHEIEVPSCQTVDSVSERLSPLKTRERNNRKSMIINFNKRIYMLSIARLAADEGKAHTIRLFNFSNMSIGKSKCSAAGK